MMIIFLLILAIVSIGAFVVWQQGEADNIIATGIKFFEPITKCNKVGDCITFNVPAQPDFKLIETEPIQPVNQTFYENGTAIPITSYITGAVADTSYTREGVKQSKYKEIGDRMIVTISNVATIEGQIKLVDENGDIVEPRLYKYWLTIECSKFTEFCNLSPRSTRDITKNGSFIYQWQTSSRDLAGLYVVNIRAESVQLDIYDRPYTVENQLFIELV